MKRLPTDCTPSLRRWQHWSYGGAGCSAFAVERAALRPAITPHVRLNAEVLTEDEDNELEDALEELSLRQSFDVTIATIESMEALVPTAWSSLPMIV